jgi:hypothetical protein
VLIGWRSQLRPRSEPTHYLGRQSSEQ